MSMRNRWVLIWVCSAVAAQGSIMYLAWTIDELSQDIGWREILAVYCITGLTSGLMQVGKKALSPTSVFVNDSLITIIICTSVAIFLMIGYALFQIWLFPYFQTG